MPIRETRAEFCRLMNAIKIRITTAHLQTFSSTRCHSVYLVAQQNQLKSVDVSLFFNPPSELRTHFRKNGEKKNPPTKRDLFCAIVKRATTRTYITP